MDVNPSAREALGGTRGCGSLPAGVPGPRMALLPGCVRRAVCRLQPSAVLEREWGNAPDVTCNVTDKALPVRDLGLLGARSWLVRSLPLACLAERSHTQAQLTMRGAIPSILCLLPGQRGHSNSHSVWCSGPQTPPAMAGPQPRLRGQAPVVLYQGFFLLPAPH